MPVSTWHSESFSVLISSPRFALGLMMAEERAERCLDAVPKLGSCTIPLPWLSTGVLPGRVFPLIKAPVLPLGGRDAGLELEPPWKDRRGWEKPGDMMVAPQRIHSAALGLGGAAGIRGQCIPFP